jgi:hypothetical protein
MKCTIFENVQGEPTEEPLAEMTFGCMVTHTHTHTHTHVPENKHTITRTQSTHKHL